MPTTIEETGLSESFLGDLISKHLLDSGILSLPQLSDRMALPGRVVEVVVAFLRGEARVEVLAGNDSAGSLRYNLTSRGRQGAIDAMARNGYVGPAPIPLNDYARVVREQSVHNANINRDDMRIAFADIVLKESLLDQLGPSVNSGRAIFIYGPAGTGKTYITQRLSRLFTDEVLIPYAISVNETVVAVFDPIQHRRIEHEDEGQESKGLMFKSQYDKRWVCCERPVLISGGELTADMLEVQLEGLTKSYQAPLQLKANNGIFIIDDMGRQRVAPETVFNRWIVPMEERKDYLSLGSGRHFSVPFDLVLVFSTNMNPADLADEAFLRRIGYKIEFGYLERDQYQAIWRDVCKTLGVVCSQDVLDFTIDELHEKHHTPLLPCHPRDLLGMAADRTAYLGQPRVVERDHLSWAWKNYFVTLDTPVSMIGATEGERNVTS
ncbi:MAG: AAA family ATPase [Pseudomonadales bacterium]